MRLLLISCLLFVASMAQTAARCNAAQFVIKFNGGGYVQNAIHANFGSYDNIITATAVRANPEDGCTTLTNSVSNKIIIIERGTCGFSAKVRHGEEAGALGVIIVNNGGTEIAENGVLACSQNDCSDIQIPSLYLSSEVTEALEDSFSSEHVYTIGCPAEPVSQCTTGIPQEAAKCSGVSLTTALTMASLTDCIDYYFNADHDQNIDGYLSWSSTNSRCEFTARSDCNVIAVTSRWTLYSLTCECDKVSEFNTQIQSVQAAYANLDAGQSNFPTEVYYTGVGMVGNQRVDLRVTVADDCQSTYPGLCTYECQSSDCSTSQSNIGLGSINVKRPIVLTFTFLKYKRDDDQGNPVYVTGAAARKFDFIYLTFYDVDAQDDSPEALTFYSGEAGSATIYLHGQSKLTRTDNADGSITVSGEGASSVTDPSNLQSLTTEQQQHMVMVRHRDTHAFNIQLYSTQSSNFLFNGAFSDFLISCNSDSPTYEPTLGPLVPSRSPTQDPIFNPTYMPTLAPLLPSRSPTQEPTSNPTHMPSLSPLLPSRHPTCVPTSKPTHLPSLSPLTPSRSPTHVPTIHPTMNPTLVCSHDSLHIGKKCRSFSLITAIPMDSIGACVDYYYGVNKYIGGYLGYHTTQKACDFSEHCDVASGANWELYTFTCGDQCTEEDPRDTPTLLNVQIQHINAATSYANLDGSDTTLPSQIFYENVGTVDGRRVDLIISIPEDCESKYGAELCTYQCKGNGCSKAIQGQTGAYGRINVQRPVVLTFTFRKYRKEHADGYPLYVGANRGAHLFEKLYVSFYDIDANEDTPYEDDFYEALTFYGAPKSIMHEETYLTRTYNVNDGSILHSSQGLGLVENPTTATLSEEMLKAAVMVMYENSFQFDVLLHTKTGKARNFLFSGVGALLNVCPSIPTSSPTASPIRPTFCPTLSPTMPTLTPTLVPTVSPTTNPFFLPTLVPSKSPTLIPTMLPTRNPTRPIGCPWHELCSKCRCAGAHTKSEVSNVAECQALAEAGGVHYFSIITRFDPMECTIPTGNAQENTENCVDSSSFNRYNKQTYQQACTVFPTSHPSRNPTLNPSSQPTAEPTCEPTRPTTNPTGHPTMIPTACPIFSPSMCPTKNPSAAPTDYPTAYPTFGPTHSPLRPSYGPTQCPTLTPTKPPSFYPSLRPTTPTLFPTREPTINPTFEPSVFPTVEPSTDPSFHPTLEPTSPTYLPSCNPTFNPTSEPSAYPTLIPTRPTSQPSRFPTSQPTRCPTFHPTVEPTRHPTKYPSNQPTIVPTIEPTRPTKCPSSMPTKDPNNDPSPQPTIEPTQPTRNPSTIPTLMPTSCPSKLPTLSPTTPTSFPSRCPTSKPTGVPSFYPSLVPTSPTLFPTRQPSTNPTTHPTKIPSLNPLLPTSNPTKIPTGQPTIHPTVSPTSPTKFPTSYPSTYPSIHPTSQPTIEPTQPTKNPSKTPTIEPTLHPTIEPTMPTKFPTSMPTKDPNNDPSPQPTMEPTQPTRNPTRIPSMSPTRNPTTSPTFEPSKSPTLNPTQPTAFPSRCPTSVPSRAPSSYPTLEPTSPTSFPSRQPTQVPTSVPSVFPTLSPTQPTSFPSRCPTVNPTTEPTLAPVDATMHPTEAPTLWREVDPGCSWFKICDDCKCGGDSVRSNVQTVDECATTAENQNVHFFSMRLDTSPLKCFPPTGSDAENAENCLVNTGSAVNRAIYQQICTGSPTAKPTQLPTLSPTRPTTHPTIEPTAPTQEPVQPTNPTIEPTLQTDAPCAGWCENSKDDDGTPFTTEEWCAFERCRGCTDCIPTQAPTLHPTISPTTPTSFPSRFPTLEPTSPTLFPTIEPTVDPLCQPTKDPSSDPSSQPTIEPTQPTRNPTRIPTMSPTTPTFSPSKLPTSDPMRVPSSYPTLEPTSPTLGPSDLPTLNPTQPTAFPSRCPTSVPTRVPSAYPTLVPTSPTSFPSRHPTRDPTCAPSALPTLSPTQPTSFPSRCPTVNPTTMPTLAPVDATMHPTEAPTLWREVDPGCPWFKICDDCKCGGDSVRSNVQTVAECATTAENQNVHFFSMRLDTSPLKCFPPTGSDAENAENCLVNRGVAVNRAIYQQICTGSPTAEPTQLPTLTPTRPTTHPTIEPTAPTQEPVQPINPTIEPTLQTDAPCAGWCENSKDDDGTPFTTEEWCTFDRCRGCTDCIPTQAPTLDPTEGRCRNWCPNVSADRLTALLNVLL